MFLVKKTRVINQKATRKFHLISAKWFDIILVVYFDRLEARLRISN